MDDLDPRARQVLKAIVQDYIATGDPVGSQMLARRAEFDSSPATLRNVMSDLEELGLIEKPHTSAGRVPTGRGYRYYVDTMVKIRPLGARDRDVIERHCQDTGRDVEGLLHEAGRLLVNLTHHAGVVVVPHPGGRYRHIEFVRLREDRVLAVLVSAAGLVQNRLLTVDFPVTQAELDRAARYLDELLVDVPLDQLSERIHDQAAQERRLYDELCNTALALGEQAVAQVSSERSRELFIEGTGTLLDEPTLGSLSQIRALFRALEEKQRILKILDRAVAAGTLSIFIGTESELGKSGEVTVVASPYGQGDQVLGSVGVIGPTRMNYGKVIPLVDYTARVLTRVLEET